MPVYELFFFPATDLMQQNNDAFLPVIDHVSRYDGVLEIRHGFTEEDNTTLYCAIKWETIDHHKAAMQGPDYPDLLEKLKPVMGGTPQLFHVEFENDATSAFDAPTTEITWINLKEGKTKADVREVLNKHMGPKIMALPGVVSGSASWNETVEDARRFVLVIGWESSKHHMEGLQEERFKGPLEKLAAVGDFTLNHVPFSTAVKKEDAIGIINIESYSSASGDAVKALLRLMH